MRLSKQAYDAKEAYLARLKKTWTMTQTCYHMFHRFAYNHPTVNGEKNTFRLMNKQSINEIINETVSRFRTEHLNVVQI